MVVAGKKVHGRREEGIRVYALDFSYFVIYLKDIIKICVKSV
jgi:hypothetical protein